MRELARVLIAVRADSVTTGSDFITGHHFDKVTDAVRKEARSYVDDSGRQLYRAPAFVLKAGNSLMKCARLKQGLAVRTNDEVALKESKNYIKLHLSEFTDSLASIAHASFRIQGNMLSEIPDEDDLRKLQQYQSDRHRWACISNCII